MLKKSLFTSESVTEGHPDKMADRVSDAILDAMLMQDKNCRCAVETLFKTGVCIVAGEVRTSAWVDVPKVVRKTINDIGYTSSEQGFDGFTCGVLVAIEGQSQDIAMGVDEQENKEQGAGDQGMMFGFACDETNELMPAPIAFAHRLSKKLSEVRKNGTLKWLRPDGKAQVSVSYEGNNPVAIDSVVLSSQHAPDISQSTLKEALMDEVIKKTLPAAMLSSSTKFHINPTGSFIIGGPMGDCGVTGRKIIVDTYGGMGRHGGGAFSGKDPSKVDRSAAYMARYIAKNLVAAKIASRCEVQLAYAIGMADPVSVRVDTFGTSKISSDVIEEVVREIMPLKPAQIIEHLNLLQPIYEPTASYGHFGRNEFPWEKINMKDVLQDKLL